MIFVGQKEGAMSASKVLALTTLFLAAMFAETGWNEFTSSEGNFRVVFPETPKNKRAPSGTYTGSVLLPATSLTD
jgi:hypothetical protein